ncbi:MAG: hypothetical protein AB7Q37_03190 [Pyrinomonadaceae bacterium]
MSKIELSPTQMHWMDNGDPLHDCCVHGGIFLSIDGFVVSDGKETEWTVSTAAFNFLRTLSEDQPVTGRESLVPCCGFTMWPVESEPDGLYMPNCDYGINWSITHDDGEVVHEFYDGTTITTPLSDWKTAVCRFADEVEEFLHSAWPKVINDDLDRRGFELFLSLWSKRRSEADDER